MSVHTHHCHVCCIPVATCAGGECSFPDLRPDCDDKECLALSHGHHYCSIHHPDPNHHIEPDPPPRR